MKRSTLAKTWFIGVNAFWLVVWLPGLWQDLYARQLPRAEDAVTVVMLLLGCILALLDSPAGRFVNIGFYLLYAVVPVVLYMRDRSDVHAAFGVMFISVPYVLIGITNLWIYRALRSPGEPGHANS